MSDEPETPIGAPSDADGVPPQNIRRIAPRRSHLALSAFFRDMADAIERGEVAWAGGLVVYNVTGGAVRKRAFDQASGWPQDEPFMNWILPLGALRSTVLDFEDQLLEAGAKTITDPQVYTS